MVNPVPPIAVNGQYPFLTPTSYTNSGTGAGTFYYVQLGSIKMLWGICPQKSLTSGTFGDFTVTFPTGFFSSIQHVSGTLYYPAGDGWQFWIENGSVSTTGARMTAKNGTGATNNAGATMFVIGT